MGQSDIPQPSLPPWPCSGVWFCLLAYQHACKCCVIALTRLRLSTCVRAGRQNLCWHVHVRACWATTALLACARAGVLGDISTAGMSTCVRAGRQQHCLHELIPHQDEAVTVWCLGTVCLSTVHSHAKIGGRGLWADPEMSRPELVGSLERLSSNVNTFPSCNFITWFAPPAEGPEELLRKERPNHTTSASKFGYRDLGI